MKFHLLFWALLALAPAPLFSDDSVDFQSFEKVWNVIHKTHWGLEELGLDWQEVYDQYAPKAKAAQSRTETRKVIREMLAELGQSHFGLLTADNYAALDALTSKFKAGDADMGIELQIIEDRLFVTRQRENSPAKQVGITVGTEILEMEGHTADEIVKALDTAFQNSSHLFLDRQRILSGLTTGPVDYEYKLKIKNTDRAAENVIVKLTHPPGKKVDYMNLKDIHIEKESRLLPDNIGYMRFNIFLFPLGDFQRELLVPLMDTDGLIIDLRGNPGGIGFLATGLLGHFIKERNQNLGTMHNTGGHLNFLTNPQIPHYGKPVAVLIDGASASTSEIMAQGVKDLKIGRIFGTPSAGAALPSLIETLPNGDRFQYAVADYVTIGGEHIEGKGVIPDETTPHTTKALKKGQDAALVAATRWISSQKRQQ